jgi:hypothetical protein
VLGLYHAMILDHGIPPNKCASSFILKDCSALLHLHQVLYEMPV